MNQKPWMIKGGMVGIRSNAQDHYRMENAKPQHQHQLQHQHQNQLQHKQQYELQMHLNQSQFQQYQQKYQQHPQQNQQPQHQNHHHHHLQHPQRHHPQNTQQQQEPQQQQQQQQQQHQQQQQQQQHHNYQQIQHPSLSPTPIPNPTYPSYLAGTDKGHSQVPRSKLDDSNFPYSSFAPAPNTTASPPSYQNQEALQQLQNNLRLVLKQQQQQQQPNPPKAFSRYQQQPGGMHVPPSQGQNTSEGPHSTTIGPSPIAYQTKPLSSYPISSNNSTAPSLTEERAGSNTNMDDNSSNSNASKQRKQQFEPPPQSYSLKQVPSPSISPLPPSVAAQSSNPTSLFALGNEFQPLSSPSQQRDISPLSKQTSSNTSNKNALIGSWSEEVTSQEAANDIFMNNLFHAELKLSRENKNSKTTIKPKPPSTTPDSSQRQSFHPPPSKIDSELEQLLSAPNRVASPREKRIDDSNLSSSDPTEIRPSKDKTKKSRRKKAKDGTSKTKQKRKSTKRKPKFPVLQKDPPIEEQILSLPAIALAPSLLASIVSDDPRYNPSVFCVKHGGNSLHQRKRERSEKYSSSKFNGHNENPPTQIFHNVLRARGHDEMYSIDLEGTEYDVVPSPLQLASYGTYLVWAVQSSNISLVRKLLGCGLSPNPCNQFRDSILGDLVCKQGNLPIYKCFVNEFNADLRVVDGFGRTLLHHCCWAHELCRPMVEDILRRDPIQIFLKDKQEKTPLEYVSADAYGTWNAFLQEVADKYWPSGSKLPELTLPFGGRRLPNGDLMDPPEALTPELAAGVASGKITPEAVVTMSESSFKNNGKQ